MKNVLFVLMLVWVGMTHAQTRVQLEELDRIKGEWKIDDNNNLLYVKVFEDLDLPKEDLYKRARQFFTYNYVNANSVMQVDNEEEGQIIAKGLYPNFEKYIYMVFASYNFSAYHVFRVDIKDNRVRVVLTLDYYNCILNDGGRIVKFDRRITETYPVNQDSTDFRKMFIKAFLSLHERCQQTLDTFEKALRKGNTSTEIESTDW